MAAIQNCPQSVAEYAAFPGSGYRNARALTAGSAERMSIPADAVKVMFAATDHFAVKFGGGDVAAAWPTDTDDGTADDLNPTIRTIPAGSTHISVIGQSTMVVVATFLKKPA